MKQVVAVMAGFSAGLWPGVSAVEITGQRGDFVVLHYDTLCASYAQGGAAQLEAAVNALDQLNAGEKNGLLYLVRAAA